MLVSAVLIWVYRYFSHTLIHQLGEPILKSVEADNVYWLLHLCKIPDFFIQKNVALCFDFGLLLGMLVNLIWVKDRGITFIIWVLWMLYFIVFHSYFMHHGHSLIGLLFVMVPFVLPERYFYEAMRGVRYYALFIYVSAGLWKLFRGDFFSLAYFSDVLQKQNIEILLQHPEHFQSKFIAGLLDYMAVTYFMWMILMLVQISFVVGFFTEKYDKKLMLVSFLFPVISCFLMNINFFEFFILWIPFLSVMNKHSREAELMKQSSH